jgi:hypothetical protein
MERPGNTRVSQNRCHKLQWKGLFIEAEWDPTIQHSNDRSYWCQDTFTCLGPDGRVADEFECNSTRTCYERL